MIHDIKVRPMKNFKNTIHGNDHKFEVAGFTDLNLLMGIGNLNSQIFGFLIFPTIYDLSTYARTECKIV